MKKLPFLFFILILTSLVFLKINSNTYAQEKPVDEEFEYILPEDNLFCNDFPLTYSNSESNVPEGATFQSETTENCNISEATIDLLNEETKQPDFTILNSRLQQTFPKLMPLQLGEKVSLDPDHEIETRAKHFWVSEQTADSCPWTPSPKENKPIEAGITKVTLNFWWSELLAGTKIFCGLFSASKQRCLPPEKLALKVDVLSPQEIEDKINLSNEEYSADCNKSQKFTQEILPTLEFIKKEVSFFSQLLKKFFSKNETTYTSTEETANLVNKTRGVVVGGHTLTNQSEFLSNFISHGIDSSLKEAPLVSNAKYEIQGEGISYNETDANQEHYQEQRQVLGRNCLQLCSLYPPGSSFDISLIDPVCDSCTPEDYQAE